MEEHPEARPLGLAYYGGMDPHLVGVEYRIPPPHANPLPHRGEGNSSARLSPAPGVGLQPGWYAVSVNFVCGASFGSYDEEGKPITFPPEAFGYFRRFDPVAKAGYSIFIYHITLEDANRVRFELGLPLLPPSGHESGRE
jgi:hypothetical protein